MKSFQPRWRLPAIAVGKWMQGNNVLAKVLRQQVTTTLKIDKRSSFQNMGKG